MDADTDEDTPMRSASARASKGRRHSPKRRDRPGVKSLDLRRPVRPVDREKMRPWLKNHLDSASVFGLTWVNKQEGVFQVSWRHASRLGWKLETDGDVFEKWARHTGIYKDGDEPEPKRWKANFRCAIHSLPDVKELTDPVERRGHNANRTYRFLQPDEIGTQIKHRKPTPTQSAVAPEPIQYEQFEVEHQTIEDSEDSASQQADSDDRNTDDDAQYREIYVIPESDHDYAVRIERQDGEESVTKILTEHGSGFVLIKTKKSSNLPTSLPTVLAEALDIPEPPKHQRPAQKSDTLPPARNIKVARKSSPFNKGKSHLRVNTKGLLSGNKTTGTRASRAGEDASHTGTGKKPGFSALMGNKEDQPESGTGSPGQTLGFEALLEAANIARMDTLTTSGVPASTSAQSTPVSASSTTAYTVYKEFPGSDPPLSPDSTATVKSEVESPEIHVHPETTEAAVSSHLPLTSVSSSLVINILQNFFGGSSEASFSVLPPEGSQISGQSLEASSVQVKDSAHCASSSSLVQHSGNTSDTARKPDGSSVVISPDSFCLVSPNNGNSVLKDLLHLRNQTVTTAPSAAIATGSYPGTSLITPQDPSHDTSVSVPSANKTQVSLASEIKTEISDPVVKIECESLTKVEHIVGGKVRKRESVGLSSSLKANENNLPNSLAENRSSGTETVVSFPAVSVPHAQLSLAAGHSIVQLQADVGAVQADAHILKDSSKSSSPGSNLCPAQAVSVTTHTESSTSSALNSGGQASASQRQTFNMGPVYVLHPSIVLTVPAQTSQDDGGSVVNLPVTCDLQDLFNLCLSGGTQQLFQNVENIHSLESVPVNSVHNPDSSVSDSVVMATDESGSEADSVTVSYTGMDSPAPAAVSASVSEDDLSDVQTSSHST